MQAAWAAIFGTKYIEKFYQKITTPFLSSFRSLKYLHYNFSVQVY